MPGVAFRRLATAATLVVCVLVSPARAPEGIPDPARCTVEDWDAYGVARMCPGENCSATLDIVVRDTYGYPMPQVPVDVELASCASLYTSSSAVLSGKTDGNGNVVLYPRVGGCENCSVVIWCLGVPIRTYPSAIGPDLNGDGAVALVDLSVFAQSYPPQPYDACSDLDASGDIGLVDLSTFAMHYGHAASGANLRQ